MTDFSECVNNMSYLVKSSSGSDTVISYVDTLIKIPLPEPKSLHVVTNSGVHAGQVREAGITTYSSPLTKERVIPLLAFIQRLSKKTTVIIICSKIIGVATIISDL